MVMVTGYRSDGGGKAGSDGGGKSKGQCSDNRGVLRRWRRRRLLMQHGLPLLNAGNGNVLEYNLVIEDY